MNTIDSNVLKYSFYKLFQHCLLNNPNIIRELIQDHGDETLLGNEGWENYQSLADEHNKKYPIGDREGKVKNLYIKTTQKKFLESIDVEYFSNFIKEKYFVEKLKIPKNIKTFGKNIGLSKLENKLLYFIFENEQTHYWYIKEYVELLMKKIGNEYTALSIILETEPQNIKNVILGNTNLFRFGFFKKNEKTDVIFSNLNYEIDERVVKIINSHKITNLEIEQIFFPTSSKTSLTLEDYGNIISSEIFENLIKSNKIGTNILLWGKPGTGKTEYAGALAKHLNYKLIRIGEGNISEKTRNQRLGDFVLAQKFYKNAKNVILLFDELEDITREDKDYSKLFFNNLLENSTVPTIFTANHIYYMETSFLRRMKYTAEFKNYTVETRKNIWKKYSKNKFTNDELNQYAKAFDITPWDIQRVCEIIELNPNEDIVKIVQQIDQVNNKGRKREFKLQNIPKHYDLSVLNTNVPVENIVNQLTKTTRLWNMLLTGPSGTGKSQLVSYLGDKLQTKVIIKKPNDLLSPYLGETEQHIAEAFHQAEQDNSILLIDEGEHFLSNKEGKSAEYMKSIANQFLVQMQNRKCNFAITTNYIDHLDQAFLRRFQIKLKFDYLTKEQKIHMFKMYWDRLPNDEILNEQYVLAPGDFETVQEFIDFGATETIENLLKIESENKKEFKKSFGFKT